MWEVIKVVDIVNDNHWPSLIAMLLEAFVNSPFGNVGNGRSQFG